MADRDNYRGYGEPSGRYYEGREYDRSGSNRSDRGRDDWRGSDNSNRGDHDRGFFEKAGDEIRSWFSDDDDRGRDHNRDRDQRYGGRDSWRGESRDYGRSATMGGRDRDFRQDASEPWGGGDRGGWSDRDWRSRRESSGGYEAAGSRYGGTSDYRSRGGRFEDRGGYGGGMGGMGSGDWRSAHPQDENYRDWRRQQMDSLDRDYDEYRRENRDKFHSEFSNWRNQRHQQRSSMRQVREHMEVCGSDGEHLGTVDKVAGDRIILTKNDPAAGGHHHSIPCSWIQSVDEKVTINKTADQAKEQWRDIENRRALFEDDDQHRGEGAHMLNRSFSGTYEDR
ncbi:hypothetical protein SCH01S_49_00010 [Sphingomonas changbaiensis NBRC 104936]|uniref:DUF2171 domain-containing protein n=1 Tax=Sphingomonas changbaiensis NBRC 104936 TaxID=1219043 RepID=A0A0E9MS37_9SPHN|nr:DUF2171 domain-containing protein [Sphingomonas changbaiensis]GAO40587.1 hypothetical protein SCH01S_49_00010 [Sphingomonas changbaiensis NBRC 104936]